MAAEPEVKEPRDTGRILFALIVACIMVAAAAVAYVAYANSQRIRGGEPYAIKSGDSVTLNYIGRLPDGRVFDTSLWYVASDNALYPKSLTFDLKSNDSYTPFTMTAGKYGSGGTIKGFALGVIGLHKGDYRIIEVPPEDGYPAEASMERTVSLNQTVPVKELYSVSSFEGYFGAEPIPQSTLSHFFWKWRVLVANVSNDIVTVLNQPTNGGSVFPFGDPTATDPSGWEVRVTSYDPVADNGTGAITIQNIVTAEDVYHIKGTDPEGGVFVVSGFDETNGTFQIHLSDSSSGYNGEISGRTLYFEVTVVSVTPSES